MYLSDPRAKKFATSLKALFKEYDRLFPNNEPDHDQADLLLMQGLYGAKNYHRETDLVLDHGEGSWMWGMDGKRYLDMNACYSAVALGYGNVELLGALMKQAFRITCAQNRLVNDMQPCLVKRIAELTGQDQVILKNAGTEAFDTAVKAARRWFYLVKCLGDERFADKAEIIVAEDNFHGRSFGALAASSTEKYRSGFGPHTPGFVKVKHGSFEALLRAVTPNTAAIIIEVIQGEGGINVADEGYFKAMQKLCAEENILLIFDEIQTGLGRTGKLFASEWTGVHPDGVILGKALGQAIPVSAFAARKDVMDLFGPGSDGSTFGGTPLACAIALKSLEMITRDNCAAVQNAHDVGAYFLEGLTKIESPLIKEVRGKGLFIGIEFDKDAISAETVFLGLKMNGLIAGVAGNNTVRFTPGLLFSKEEAGMAVECIHNTLQQLSAEALIR